MHWTGRGKDRRGETENKEKTLKNQNGAYGKPWALIFYADAKNTGVLYGRKINGKPTGGCGSLEIPAVNADGGCNQHEAMRNHGVSFF